MMRTLAVLVGGVFAGMLAATGPAAAQATVWQGFLFITSVNSTCTAQGTTAVEDYYTSVYRPNIAPPPTGQAKEALLISFGRGMSLLEAKGSTLRGKASATVTEFGSRAEYFSGPATVDLKITPSIIKASTPVVQISGTIENFLNVTGCTAGVRGAFGLRP
jgi:hypothetical protein